MKLAVQAKVAGVGKLDLRADVPKKKPSPIDGGDHECLDLSFDESEEVSLTVPQATELVRLLSTALGALARS